MKLNRFLLLLLVLILSLGVVAACGDDDDDDDDDDTPADGDDDDGDDDDDDDDDDGWPGTQELTVATPEGDVTVSLAGLPMVTYTDPETSDEFDAVAIKDVVDQAFAKAFDPADYKFNPIASDGYNVLIWKLDGDFRGLPGYADLALGWFIACGDDCDESDDIMAVWDESLELPGFMKARYMKNGTFEMVEEILYDQTAQITVQYATTTAKTAVDLNGLPAFYDGDGDLAVYVHHIILEAALDEFDPKTYTYAFDFIANDDYSLLEHIEGLGDDVTDLPWWEDFAAGKDVHHGWIKSTDEDGFRAFWDEASSFPSSYGISHMEDGTIECHDITDLID